MITENSKIFVAGHLGMVGSALVRILHKNNYNNLILRNKKELDLTNQKAVKDFMQSERPDWVLIAAAKVGGIYANNTYPAEFIYSNLMMEANLIHESYSAGVKKLLFLGSSCIYPKLASQPMKESSLLTGTLEPTNEPYALAKIAGIKLCESYNRQYQTDYRSLMPSNLYGPNDNFNLENSHVIPALIKKIHQAKINQQSHIEVWGTGTAKREFLHVDDLAEACVKVMHIPKNKYDSIVQPMCSHINVGYGRDISISELVDILMTVIEYKGDVNFDTSKPDGAPQKLMDTTLINQLGWSPAYTLSTGLKQTYHWFLENYGSTRN